MTLQPAGWRAATRGAAARRGMGLRGGERRGGRERGSGTPQAPPPRGSAPPSRLRAVGQGGGQPEPAPSFRPACRPALRECRSPLFLLWRAGSRRPAASRGSGGAQPPSHPAGSGTRGRPRPHANPSLPSEALLHKKDPHLLRDFLPFLGKL